MCFGVFSLVCTLSVCASHYPSCPRPVMSVCVQSSSPTSLILLAAMSAFVSNTFTHPHTHLSRWVWSAGAAAEKRRNKAPRWGKKQSDEHGDGNKRVEHFKTKPHQHAYFWWLVFGWPLVVASVNKSITNHKYKKKWKKLERKNWWMINSINTRHVDSGSHLHPTEVV